jgi:uncharacterized membrane-anchored protein YhcB (DUF1043 family)
MLFAHCSETMTTLILHIITFALGVGVGYYATRLLRRKQHHRQQAAALRSWHRYTDLRPR